MARTLLLAVVVLLSAAWVQAQYGQSSGSQSSASNSSGQTKVQGCLQGSNGSYTLTSDSGTTYQLSGDTSKLTKHVGHEVEITGSTSGSSSASTGASPTTGTPTNSAEQSLSVEHVKHISETCTSKTNK